MSEPQGLTCPGCGSPPRILLTDQAFCGNDDCHVMMWNPNKTLDELAADAKFDVQLPDFGGSDGPRR